VVTGMRVEGVALASVLYFGASLCVVSSLGRRGLMQPLWSRARHVRALLWPLFAWSAWVQKATVVADNR
jgi:hypothetical protein